MSTEITAPVDKISTYRESLSLIVDVMEWYQNRGPRIPPSSLHDALRNLVNYTLNLHGSKLMATYRKVTIPEKYTLEQYLSGVTDEIFLPVMASDCSTTTDLLIDEKQANAVLARMLILVTYATIMSDQPLMNSLTISQQAGLLTSCMYKPNSQLAYQLEMVGGLAGLLKHHSITRDQMNHHTNGWPACIYNLIVSGTGLVMVIIGVVQANRSGAIPALNVFR